MNIGIIIFICIYSLVLIAYFITETSGKLYLRAPNKTLLALMFVGLSIAGFITKSEYSLDSMHLALLLAIILAALGDIFLLFDFGRGGDFFMCCNLCFFFYEFALLGNNGFDISKTWFVFVIFAVLIGTWILLFNLLPNVFKTGSLKWPMLMYLASITLHGSAAITVLILMPQMWLLSVGSILFMISDFLLVIYKFVTDKNPWVLRANSCTYFVGMLLIALSIIL